MINRRQFKKGNEFKSRNNNLEKRRQIEKCLEENQRIPHNLREDAKDILDDIIYNNENTEDGDEEFMMTKICITTSHSPSSKLKEFAKHLSLIFNGILITRSKRTLDELKEILISQRFTHSILLNESKGNPSTLILSNFIISKTYYFTISNISNILNLQNKDTINEKFGKNEDESENKKASGERVHLVLDGFNGVKFGKELYKTLSTALPVFIKEEENRNKDIKRKIKCRRLLGILNKKGTILFRHFTIENNNGKRGMKILKKECFFNLKLYKICGSIFDPNVDVLYTLGGFMNSGLEKDILQE